MTSLRLLFAFSLPLAVSACAIPDLVAHGVKEFEKSREASVQPANAPAEARPVPQPAVVRRDAPPEPVYSGPAPVAPRDDIKVETLK